MSRSRVLTSSVPEIANELPDLFSNTLHMENYEDDEHFFQCQKDADEIAWYMNKWEIKSWYSSAALRGDLNKIDDATEATSREDS